MTQLYKVTFYNKLAGRRGVVIDNISEDEANQVVAKVSDRKQPYFYLDEVKK